MIKVKEESEKVGLKLNIQKTKIMASGPITSWQIDGETMETDRLYFGGSKITLDIGNLTIPKPLTVWITTNSGKFFKRWEYQTRPPDLPLKKPVCRSGSST